MVCCLVGIELFRADTTDNHRNRLWSLLVILLPPYLSLHFKILLSEDITFFFVAVLIQREPRPKSSWVHQTWEDSCIFGFICFIAAHRGIFVSLVQDLINCYNSAEFWQYKSSLRKYILQCLYILCLIWFKLSLEVILKSLKQDQDFFARLKRFFDQLLPVSLQKP
jgi:hypothetical protein